MQRFSLLLIEADTGIILAEDGNRHSIPAARFELLFTTRESALAAKDALLARYAWAMVVIRDAESSGSAVEYIDQAGYNRFWAARDAWRRWHSAFPLFRLFRRKPPDPWRR